MFMHKQFKSTSSPKQYFDQEKQKMDGYVARGYQLEMLDQSLKENIILVVCRIHN